MAATYTDEDIKTLDWREHIRLRPGMYIGKLGDGSSPDDGIYVLLKEVIDNPEQAAKDYVAAVPQHAGKEKAMEDIMRRYAKLVYGPANANLGKFDEKRLAAVHTLPFRNQRSSANREQARKRYRRIRRRIAARAARGGDRRRR